MPIKAAGITAKYLPMSFASEKVVNAPRVMSICLPIRTMSMSFAGLESRSTMLAASRAACVPVFIATATSACARAGESLVPSPVMATMCPASCSSLTFASFFSGVASARKSSTPASEAIVAAVSVLSPVIITVRIPMRLNCANCAAIPGLTVSLSSTTASAFSAVQTMSAVEPRPETTSARPVRSAGTVLPPAARNASTASAAPLR